MAKKKEMMHTIKDAGIILGLSRPSMVLAIEKAKIELTPMINPETGRLASGLSDIDIEAIRKFRSRSDQDTRKP